MSDPTERHDPPLTGSEAQQLLGFLDYHRATLQQKAAGLDADGLRARLPSSSLTLGGLLKHLALVEDNWFSVVLHGREPAPTWAGVDWDADPDWEFRTAADDDPDELRELLAASVEQSRRDVQGLALDHPSVRHLHREDAPATLRWIVLHMIEEYARHNGHADLLREAVDGSVGE